MKFRFIRFLSLFWLSIALVTACIKTTPTESQVDLLPLKVGYSLWSGYYPITLAQEKGFFEQQGVQVAPIYTENYLTSVSDFSAGKSDGIVLTLTGVINVLGKNPDVQIVMVTDESSGGDALVVQSSIKSVAELKGKRLGVKLGEFGELFVITLLEKHGLTSDEVNLINVEGEAVPAGLLSGDIQAGHTWNPYIEKTVRAGAKVLFTSQQTPGLIPSVLIFRNQVISDRPDEVRAFIRTWFQAQNYWKAHPDESKALIAKALNLKLEDVSLDGDRWYTLKDNLKALTPSAAEESLYHTANVYADFLIRTGGLSIRPNIEKLVNPSFIRDLQEKNRS